MIADPKEDGMRSERLEARLSKHQKSVLKQAAEMQGQTLTEFVISSAVEAARSAIQSQEILLLTRQDQEAFVTALLNPPEPNEHLKRAAERHRTLIGT